MKKICVCSRCTRRACAYVSGEGVSVCLCLQIRVSEKVRMQVDLFMWCLCTVLTGVSTCIFVCVQ